MIIRSIRTFNLKKKVRKSYDICFLLFRRLLNFEAILFFIFKRSFSMLVQRVRTIDSIWNCNIRKIWYSSFFSRRNENDICLFLAGCLKALTCDDTVLREGWESLWVEAGRYLVPECFSRRVLPRVLRKCYTRSPSEGNKLDKGRVETL